MPTQVVVPRLPLSRGAGHAPQPGLGFFCKALCRRLARLQAPFSLRIHQWDLTLVFVGPPNTSSSTKLPLRRLLHSLQTP